MRILANALNDSTLDRARGSRGDSLNESPLLPLYTTINKVVNSRTNPSSGGEVRNLQSEKTEH